MSFQSAFLHKIDFFLVRDLSSEGSARLANESWRARASHAVDIGSLTSAPIAANLVPNILGQLVMSAVCAASAVMVTRAVAAKTTKSASLSKASPARARGRASVATRAVELATGETLEVKPVPMRVGHGFDLHRMETLATMPDLELWLGGIKLEHDRGCVAHSDGDVLLHCVFDAITGALGLPDIGQCFPDNDPKWKGCTSDVFIKEAVRLMRDSGYEMGNIDCTIIAQKPKISPHKKAIKENLARLLECDEGVVNVKAKTHEKVDSLGENRSIACHTVCMLVKV